MRRTKILAVLLLAIMTVTLLIPTYSVAAATTPNVITKTLNLATVSKNARGDGYEWANLTNTLTLDNLNINTSDEFGMKLPKDATVILKGKNYITAANVGLVCTGQVTFEGTGSLTIVAGDTGIDFSAVLTDFHSRFRSGTINVTAGKTAIHSPVAELTFMGSKVELTVNGDDAERKAVDGRTVNVSGGDVTANAPIYASNAMTVTAVNANVSSATGAAFSCPNGIKMSKVDISVGASADSLAKAESYNGEASVKLTSTVSNTKYGILFGGKLPAFVDYIVFALLIIAVAALIVVPIYIKKVKTQKLIAEYEAANPTKKAKSNSEKQTQNNKASSAKKK